jgi:hypothetical protein
VEVSAFFASILEHIIKALDQAVHEALSLIEGTSLAPLAGCFRLYEEYLASPVINVDSDEPSIADEIDKAIQLITGPYKFQFPCDPPTILMVAAENWHLINLPEEVSIHIAPRLWFIGSCLTKFNMDTSGLGTFHFWDPSSMPIVSEALLAATSDDLPQYMADLSVVELESAAQDVPAIIVALTFVHEPIYPRDSVIDEEVACAAYQLYKNSLDVLMAFPPPLSQSAAVMYQSVFSEIENRINFVQPYLPPNTPTDLSEFSAPSILSRILDLRRYYV